MRYTLMQISDIHTGAPFLPEVAEAVAATAHDIQPDLLVVAGDLVQRAVFPSQWHTVRAFLEQLPQPQLIVPGNHDVPLIDGFRRLVSPLAYYRRYISENLNPQFHLPGLVVVGANSALGFTVADGYLYKKQRQAVQQAFAGAPDNAFRVAVLHHPLIDPPIMNRADKLLNANRVLRLLQQCGVQLYLSGHMHFPYISAIDARGLPIAGDQLIQRSLIISQTGTATSRRGRGPGEGQNTFNTIELTHEIIRIQIWQYMAGHERFTAVATQEFPR